VGGLAVVAVVAVVAPGPGPAGGAADGHGPVVVPVTTEHLGHGADQVSYVVTHISVAGGRSIPVQLDTGSSGLDVFSSAVGPHTRSTGHDVSISYVGSTLSGVLATGSVTVGGLSTPSTTTFIAFSKTKNPAVAKWFADEGVDGILGVGMGAGGTGNPVWYSPLLQLPSPYWQGFTLRVAARGDGSLTIGPVTHLAGATALAMQPGTTVTAYPGGVPDYQKDFVACWSVAGGTPGCGNTDMDLGAPGPLFGPGALPGATTSDDGAVVSPGTAITATTPTGTRLWSYTSSVTDRLTRTELVAQGHTEFNTGIGWFFDHTVAYDVAQGQFLVAPA